MNLRLELTEDAVTHLIKEGYNPDFGARPLRRAIERCIEDPMSEKILQGEFEDKNAVYVTKTEDGLAFEARKEEEEESTAGA